MNATELREKLDDLIIELDRLDNMLDLPVGDLTIGEYEVEREKLLDEFIQTIAATLGNGECELEPLSAIDVTLNMLNVIGWGRCSECGYATPEDSNCCQNCGRKVVTK